MSQPIIPGKLTAPPRPAGYLPRPRLDDRWRDWRDCRLVTVTAGAGFGKTSLLTAAVASCRRPVAWYSLDEMDTDPAVFRDHLLAAVSGGASRGGDDPDRDLAETVRVLRDTAGGSVLILDDMQLAAGTTEVLVFIERLVRYLPAGHTLVLASREPLDIASMKLRTQGVLAELQAADLAFRPDEAAALFETRFPGAALDAELAELVVRRTEGWAAGLEILLQALDGPREDQVRAALARLLEAGSGWFAYFAEEVLRQLPDATRDFMRRSSLLPRLDSELCDAVLGREGSGRVLADLCRRNLFTVRLGRARGGYRYHGLFQDFLREVQAREGEPAESLRLWREAARILEARGEWGDAMLAHAEGGAHGAALSLLEKRGEDLLAAGRHETIRRTLAALPASALARRPVALLAQGRVLEAQGDLRGAEATYRKALSCATSGRQRVSLMSKAAQVKLRLGRYQACINLCRKALREPGRADAIIRGRLLDMIGICMCDLGRLDEGERHLLEAREAFGKSRDEEEEARAFYLLQSNIHYRRGDFHRAKDAARRALVVFRKRDDLRRVCHCLGVLSHITADACEVREARELAREGLRLAGSLDYQLIEGYCRLALGRCALATGDHERAREHYAAAEACGERVGESGLLVFPQLGLAEAAARAGRRHEARRLARGALAASVERKLIYQEAQARFLLGALAERSADVRRHWCDAEKTMRSVGMRYDLHHLLLARLDAKDAKPAARPALLAELLSGVAEMGHDFVFTTLARDRALRVLPEGLSRDATAEEAARHLTDLGTDAVAAVQPLLRDEDADVRARAAAVIDRIGGETARAALGADEAASAGASLAIRALGPLSVTIDERRLTLDDWRSKRALRLFQYLLVRRFRWVPRDEVIEALWPDTEIGKGLNSLRQTLHVLRRTLAGGKETRADRFVRYHNEALRLEPGDGYAYDVEQCEDLLQEAESLWSDGDTEAAVEPLLDAERLYRGHFLAESPYEEFTAEEREHLRDRLLQDVGRLCAWYARHGKWRDLVPLARRAVALDAYHEEFHQRLVEGLAGLGHRAEALEAYHQYEKLMIEELDLLPSNRLKSLVEKIATQ